MKNIDKNVEGFLINILEILVLSFVVILPFVFAFHINLSDPLDASMVNGVVAAIAILFGFVSFEARDIKSLLAKYVLLSTLILFLMITSWIYFMDVMRYGHATKFDFLMAMINLYFNVLSSIIVIRARTYV
jgi:hypothetical protein